MKSKLLKELVGDEDGQIGTAKIKKITQKKTERDSYGHAHFL